MNRVITILLLLFSFSVYAQSENECKILFSVLPVHNDKLSNISSNTYFNLPKLSETEMEEVARLLFPTLKNSVDINYRHLFSSDKAIRNNEILKIIPALIKANYFKNTTDLENVTLQLQITLNSSDTFLILPLEMKAENLTAAESFLAVRLMSGPALPIAYLPLIQTHTKSSLWTAQNDTNGVMIDPGYNGTNTPKEYKEYSPAQLIEYFSEQYQQSYLPSLGTIQMFQAWNTKLIAVGTQLNPLAKTLTHLIFFDQNLYFLFNSFSKDQRSITRIIAAWKEYNEEYKSSVLAKIAKDLKASYDNVDHQQLQIFKDMGLSEEQIAPLLKMQSLNTISSASIEEIEKAIIDIFSAL